MSAQPNAHQAPWTITRLLAWTAEYLSRQGVDDARLAAEVLLADALGCRRIELYTRFDQVPDAGRVVAFRSSVKRAAAHEPIAYIVGEKEFFSLPFSVTHDVLIPRPETETLVECVIDHCRAAELTHARLLDLGTGSGCIAIAALSQLAGATAVGTDVSGDALVIARANAERNGVADRFTPVLADRLDLPADVVPDGGFDVIMSNPPYIAETDMAALPSNVRDFEPCVALSDGADGLSFYDSLAVDGPRWLASHGVVIVEVADGHAADTVIAMERGGRLAHRTTRMDRVVGQERVLTFVRRE